MAIIIQTPKGPVEFPDGTPKDVIQAQVRKASGFKEPLQQRETYNYQDPNAGNVGHSLLRGATFDMSDEIMGGIAASYAKMHDLVTGNKSGISYEDAVKSVRQDQEAFAERNPGIDLTAQLAGGIMTGGVGGAKVLGSQTLKQAPKFIQAAAIPTVAGVEGAAYGFGSGEGMEESLQQAGQQGLVSAVAGPLLNKLGTGVARKFNKKEAKELQQKLTPDRTLESVKGEAKEFYNKAEAAGVVIRGKSFDDFRTALMNDLSSEAIDGQTYPKIGKALRRLKDTNTPSYKDIEAVKKLLKQARMSADPNDRRIAGMINAQIDGFVENLKPGDIVAGSIPDLNQHLKQAKNLWSRKAQTEVIDEIEDKAYRSEANVKAGDLDQAFRSKIRPVIENPRRKSGLDEEVVTSLDKMISGTPGKNLIRTLASVNPGSHTQRGLMSTLGAGAIGVAATGSPAGVLLAVVPGITGTVAQKIANKMSKKEIDKIRSAILNKDQLEVNDIVTSMMEPYQDMISGVAANLGAQASGTTLQDMM